MTQLYFIETSMVMPRAAISTLQSTLKEEFTVYNLEVCSLKEQLLHEYLFFGI